VFVKSSVPNKFQLKDGGGDKEKEKETLSEVVVPSAEDERFSVLDERARAASHSANRQRFLVLSAKAHVLGDSACAVRCGFFVVVVLRFHTEFFFFLKRFRRLAEREERLRSLWSGGAIVDLHGLFVDEALGVVRNALEMRGRTVHFVTGRGKHSLNGPRIRPAVISLLEEIGILWEMSNPGVVVVHF
jgi:hypothetical protein